jgi:hypothetical protein
MGTADLSITYSCRPTEGGETAVDLLYQTQLVSNICFTQWRGQKDNMIQPEGAQKTNRSNKKGNAKNKNITLSSLHASTETKLEMKGQSYSSLTVIQKT